MRFRRESPVDAFVVYRESRIKSVAKYIRSGTVVRKGRSKTPLPGVCRFVRCADLIAQMKEREQDFLCATLSRQRFALFTKPSSYFPSLGIG